MKRECLVYRCDFCGAEELVNKGVFGALPKSVPEGWIGVLITTNFEDLQKHLCTTCRAKVTGDEQPK